MDSREFPIDGIEIWKNEKNRFCIFQIHYEANPMKRDPEYRNRVKASMPRRKYLQEYELQWDSFAGLPVYEDYKDAIHGSKEHLEPELGLPLLRGWDFGLTPACVVCQLQGDQLVVLYEYVAFNMGIKRFAQMVLQQLKIRYPEWPEQKRDWRDFIDPAGFAKADTNERSCAEVLGGYGLRLTPGPIPFERRKGAVDYFLTKINKQGPCFQLSLPECPVLAKGFRGGYRYPKAMSEVESLHPKPIKDEHSHPHDALQYVAHGVQGILSRQKRGTVNIPGPHYSLMDNKDGHGQVMAPMPPKIEIIKGNAYTRSSNNGEQEI